MTQAIAEEIRMSQLTSHVIYTVAFRANFRRLGPWEENTRDSIWARSAAVYGDGSTRLPNFQQTFDPFVTSCEITHLFWLTILLIV